MSSSKNTTTGNLRPYTAGGQPQLGNQKLYLNQQFNSLQDSLGQMVTASQGLQTQVNANQTATNSSITSIQASITTINTALANLIPSGTIMLFQQASAPTGWTKITTHNDALLRVVSGTPSSGGTNAFSTVNAQTVVGSHTLAAAEMPAHYHTASIADPTHSHGVTGGIYGGTTSAGLQPASSPTPYNTAAISISGAGTGVYLTSGNGTNTVNTAGSGGAHNHTISFNIAYVDLILASKN